MSTFEKFQRFLILLLVSASFFYGGYYFGKRGYEIELKKNPPKVTILNKNPGDREVDFAQFWEVWDLVNTYHLQRPLDAQELVYGAIEGMVNAIGDPYTSYLPPTLNEQFDDNLSGTYEGIGAQLGMEEGQVIVISPFDGSPAKEAGLRPKDKILAIDGETTYGSSLNEAVAKIRGAAGTTVKLNVQNKDEAAREVAITRGSISVPSVSWEDKGDGIAYIRVSRFGPGTNENWADVVSKVNLNMKELDAVIVDLRSNPGGLLSSAVYIAGEFFDKKPVLYREAATGEQTSMDADRVGIFRNVPRVVVLIDEGSASASEILAAALHDQVGAILVGNKSFGKGTVQSVQDFEDGSGLHLTTEKWLTPKKVWVHEKGIEPEYNVELTQEDIINQKDTQLEKAIELAKEI